MQPVNGSSQKQRRNHLRLVRDNEPGHPRRVDPLMLAMNLLAVGFVAFVGYSRAGLRGAVILTVVALAVAWGFRRAGKAADRVSGRNRRPPTA
jgi:hypothetical protein